MYTSQIASITAMIGYRQDLKKDCRTSVLFSDHLARLDLEIEKLKRIKKDLMKRSNIAHNVSSV